MEASTRNLKIDLDSLICRETSYAVQFNGTRFLAASSIDALKEAAKTDNGGIDYEFLVSTDESYVSDKTKILLHLSDKIYHFMVDGLALLLKLYRADNNVHFMLYLEDPLKTGGWFYQAVFQLLDSLGVSYTKIYMGHDQVYSAVYKMNNFLNTDEGSFNIHRYLSFVDVEYAVDVLTKFYKSKDKYPTEADGIKPFRKVYLSRAHISGNLGLKVDADAMTGYSDDKRVDDESLLEEIFANAGFEIVIPERAFGSFKEQVRFMSEVKVLASMTSSGLTNLLFMNAGIEQTVLEIKAEVVAVESPLSDGTGMFTKQVVPHEFEHLAYMKGHLYIGVPSRRVASELVDVLKALVKGPLLSPLDQAPRRKA